MTFFDFENFMILLKFSKITKIFQKKKIEPKKIMFVGVEFFLDGYYMNF